MSEFIGARISLVSKSDIRYVGTLHEINSENSTVALEQVTSFGTEGRKLNPEEEIAGNDNVYEYIVFRGSDVKDLRIEEPPKENKPPPPPQIPNDPAILGSGSRPQHTAKPSQQNFPPRGPQPPYYPQQPPYPYQYPPYQPQRFGAPNGIQGGYLAGPAGPVGPPGGYPGYPGMPYGAPPGWYPHPAQNFPGQPGPFSPPPAQMPIGPPGGSGTQQQGPKPTPQQPIHTPQQQFQAQQPQAQTSGLGPPAERKVPSLQPSAPASFANKPTQSITTSPANLSATLPTADTFQKKDMPPPPPTESKPNVAEALAAPISQTQAAAPPTVPKSGRIVPAVPLPNTQVKGTQQTNGTLQATSGNAPHSTPSAPGKAAADAAVQYQNATQAATAAVAAAMAKLPPAKPMEPTKPAAQGTSAVDNLANKVAEMRTDNQIRHGREPGTGGYAAGHRGWGRGGRGARRGSVQATQSRGVEVPAEDFDFESANAKFNRQDLVKEEIATGLPLGSSAEDGTSEETNGMNGTAADGKDTDVVIPAQAPGYNKSSSFFDNISSEAKDREEAAVAAASGASDGAGGFRGRGWGAGFRNQERRRNLETFGQGSVDGLGFGRGSFRGRGRGGGFRGRVSVGGFRGRGQGFRGRGTAVGAGETGG